MTKQPASYPVTVDWVHRMQFVARDDKNHSIVLDTSSENGGDDSGPSPAKAMLMAVAACTSMDVVDIMRKSRQNLVGLSVSARGSKTRNIQSTTRRSICSTTSKG